MEDVLRVIRKKTYKNCIVLDKIMLKVLVIGRMMFFLPLGLPAEAMRSWGMVRRTPLEGVRSFGFFQIHKDSYEFRISPSPSRKRARGMRPIKKPRRFGRGLKIFYWCSIRPKVLFVIEYFVFNIIAFQQSQDTLVIPWI